MKKLLLFSLIAVLLVSSKEIIAQEVKKLTFEEVIKLSEEQSPNALIAKHRFRSSYWEYRSFQAQYLPSLTLSGTTPDFSNGLIIKFMIHSQISISILRKTQSALLEPSLFRRTSGRQVP